MSAGTLGDGSERHTTRRVVFARPFTLGKSAEVYPAGAYEVETAETVFEGVEHTAHIRTSTVLVVPTPTGTCDRMIVGKDLDEALRLDVEATKLSRDTAVGQEPDPSFEAGAKPKAASDER
jgi:hypothetical protein